MKEILVVGFGNPLMADDGIGPRLIEELSHKKEFPAHVKLIDLGTSGTKLLHKMQKDQKVVIIDSADFKASPGSIRRFSPEDVKARKMTPRLSLHEGNLLDILELAKEIGEHPDEIVLFGIQPEVVHVKEGLSPSLESKVAEYTEIISRELLSPSNSKLTNQEI